MVIDLSPARKQHIPEAADRDALVRAFTAWTGNAAVADELAQETLYAAWLGMHEKALHRHLITERADSAVTLGLVSEPDTWVESDIRCPVCGRRLLRRALGDGGDQ